jgi:NAD+ kinase
MIPKPKSIKRVALVSNKHLDRNGAALIRTAVRFLKKRKIEVLYNKHVAKQIKQRMTNDAKIMKKADFVISFGGDGTLIKLARHIEYKMIPILAVNMGNVGFMSEIQRGKNMKEKLEVYLKKIIDSKKYRLDVRSMLRVTVYRDNEKIETFLALNEAVINQGNFARLIELDASIDQRKMVRFKADGMIVATPTGSTGHSLSAGGPIVHPRLDALVFTPICPATLSMCPIVIPSNRMLTVTIETKRKYADNDIGLTIDGQTIIKLQYGDKIKFRRSSRHFVLARATNTKYYKILRERLGWGD